MDSSKNTIFDWEKSLSACNHSKELVLELLGLFNAEFPTLCALIKDAEEKEDLISLGKVIHKLRGACAYCCFPQLQTTLTAVDEKIQTNRFTAVKPLLENLHVELKQVETELKNMHLA